MMATLTGMKIVLMKKWVVEEGERTQSIFLKITLFSISISQPYV